MYDESSLKEMFEEAANGEKIISAVIGHFDGWDNSDHEKIARDKRTIILPWEEAAKLISYKYDSGYGGADCHPVFAWTENRILFVHEYDGATGVLSVPRNPTNCTPEFI